jgi:hypothetical protein
MIRLPLVMCDEYYNNAAVRIFSHQLHKNFQEKPRFQQQLIMDRIENH